MHKKQNKYYIFIPIIIALSFAGGLLLGSKLDALNQVNIGSKTKGKLKLNQLIDFIDTEYVDKINTDSIVDLTVSGILENLDPHSVYIPKEQLASVNESMEGNFVGIGVNFYMYKDTLTVIKPIPNGPSEKAGIQSGDRILYANNKQLFNKKYQSENLFPILKGKIDTPVNLIVYRKSENKKFKVTVVRNLIPVKSIDVATKINYKTGYIKVNRFAETTFNEFHNALVSLKKQRIKEVIIDLRENSGGYLEMAVAMADEFLKDKQVIVKTKNKKGNVDISYATSKGIFETGRVYVLIDENSASASEIFAGAIQDNDRGTIIGRRSFGKGLVQREMKMNDGSAVRLTIARYFTPSGRSIQKPYEDKGEKYFNEFEKRFLNGELYEADSIKVADSLKFKTKKGRIVYGGGGITPDVFVPIEKNHSKEGLSLLLQSDIMSYYAFEKLDENRSFFSKINAIQLKNELFKNDKYFIQFKEYLTSNGLLFNISFQKEQVLTYLFAEFSKQLFNDTSYYQIVLPLDKMITKVLSKQK